MTTRDVRKTLFPRWLGRLLVDCVRAADAGASVDVDPDVQRRVDPELLVDAASWHRVAGCAAVALRDADWIAPSAATALERARAGAVVRHLVAVAELKRIDAAFAAAEVPWVTFKGPVLAATAYPRPDVRSSVDVDVLVTPRHAARALTTLESGGYQVVEADWCRLAADGAAEVALTSPTGVAVDLHWGLISDSPTRAEFTIPTEELVLDCTRVLVGGALLPALQPPDALVHLALHAALGGGNRLVWLNDLDHVVRSQLCDWDDVITRAHIWSAGAAVAVMLTRARRYLATPVPDRVLRLLCPGRAWLAGDAAATFVAPVPRLAVEPSVARLIARSARNDGGSSARALVRHSGLGVVRRGVWRMQGITESARKPAVTDTDPAAHERARTSLLDAAAASEWS